METPDPSDQRATNASPGIAVVVLASPSADLTGVFTSIDLQVYEPVVVFVVSRERPKANVAMPAARWAASVADVVAAVPPETEYLWILDPRADPRPDALRALVDTAVRVDASVVGSKLLNVQRNEELVSVGGATDVFGFPFTGIEDGEVDQEQYDVIRDVAYVEPASMLVRRDLAAGLGGLDPKLPYLSAGLDFCQRARLAGGRVVVAPTSEVAHGSGSETARALTWREQAGRIRSMLKAYSILTLAWALPGLAAIGLLLGLYRTFNGSPLALLDWLRAWVWNLVHLPTTITGRRRARGSRSAGDNELFRYQVKGSVEVRAVASAVGALLQGEEDEDGDIVDLLDVSPGFWQQPAFLAAMFGTVFVAAFTRVIWSAAMPVTGFALPLGDSAWNTLRAFAGGWHLGGLGSPEAMHPSIGATAAVQLLLGNRAELASVVITIAAVGFGAAGMTRFVRRLGLGHAARYLSGAVFVAGVPMVAIVGDGYWPALLAAGGLPWVLAAVVQPIPVERRPQLGRLARVTLAMAWTTMMMPVLIVVPVAFALAWSVATRTIRPLIRAVVVTVLALPMLFPWLLSQSPSALFGDGVPYHFDPTWWTLAPVAIASASVVLAGRGIPARMAATGTLMASVGILAARASDLGAGRDVTAAGSVVASLGMALVVAAALDVLGPLDSAAMVRRSIGRLGIAGAVGVVLLVLISIPSGRAMLPSDDYSSLAFAESRAGSHGSDRLLLIGPSDQMPGEYRRLRDGTAYRLVGGVPTFPQAWLADSRAGDDALAATLEGLAQGTELRPGEALAAFGVQWVVFTGDTTLTDIMTAQLDLRPLPQLVFQVFESEVEAYRAVTGTGLAWSWVAPDYTGRALRGTVRIAENADPRWGPGWTQTDWANEVSTIDGVAHFGGVPAFRLFAQLAAALAIVLLGIAMWGRPARPSLARKEGVSV